MNEKLQVGMIYINTHPRAYGSVCLSISSSLNKDGSQEHKFESEKGVPWFFTYSEAVEYLFPLDML